MLRNFFHGISLSQILAGALAAVTSFLLSAKIGIAGSVIGVAVGSIVSAVASQIYRNVLQASGAKLQDKLPLNSASGDTADTNENAETDVATDGTPEKNDALAAEDTTGAHDTLTADDEDVSDAAHSPRTVSSSRRRAAYDTAPVRRFADLRREANAKRAKRIGIVVAVVSALAAVGITAGIIMAATQGRGTDSVVRDWVSPGPGIQQTPQTPETTPLPESGQDDGSNPNEETPDSTTNGGDEPNDSGTSDGTGTDTGTGTGNNGSNGSGEGSGSSTGNGTDTGDGSNDSGTDGGSTSNNGDDKDSNTEGGTGANDGTNPGNSTGGKEGANAQNPSTGRSAGTP